MYITTAHEVGIKQTRLGADERGRATRGTFIVVLLLTTLILAGALAYQAVDSVASHRATANAILRDYAAFAAEQYGERISQDLEYYGLYPTLQRLAGLGGANRRSPVPTRAGLQANANRGLTRSLGLVRYLFRFDPRTGEVIASPNADESPPEWLGERLTTHAESVHDSTTYSPPTLALLEDGDSIRSFAYTIVRGEPPTGPVGYGFEVDRDTLAAFFAAVLKRAPLLPATLTGGISYDSMISEAVRMADNSEFLDLTERVAPRGYGALATHTLHPRFGQLSVQVSLDPEAADMLIIGGLPTSRLPFILGLFLLTAGLIAAALLQFRREQELDRLRTEFVSNVSHELRTPLAQIRMFAETLLLGRVRSDEEHNRSLAIIDRETRRLTHLVENVLLFSQSERRTMRLERQTVELQPLLREVVESFRPLAEAQETSVAVSSDAMLVNVDAGALQQIVLNLLDNAIKYGPSGQHVLVTAEYLEGRARICVEDEGPGIPEADRTRVWEQFGRLERERQSSNAGTGIGLAVVKELARLHEGRAYVETGKRGGARFVIELPGAQRVDEAAVEQVSASPEDPAMHPTSTS